VSDPLELDSDPRFQRWEWTLQRVGWALLLLVIAAGLAGVLGDGPIAHGHEHTADGALDVRFEKLLRKRAPAAISILVRASSDAPRLWVSRETAKKLDIKRIEPEPSSVSGDLERLVYEFQGAGRELLVTLHIEALEAGPVRGSVGIVGGPSVGMNQFVFP
jgi:hypothetical protein